jgi:1-acyl-sn-glycerol-3-phosphate acyltransferase
MQRIILRAIVRLLFRLLAQVEVYGLDNIPESGAGLLCANHLGFVDAPLVFSLLERKDSTALVAHKYRRNLFFRWIVSAVQGIWLNREEADTQALRAARDHLRQGGLLGIAPEGTRSHTGGLITPKTGAAFLAGLTHTPVLPMAIYGTEAVGSAWRRLRRPRIIVQIGKPFTLPLLDRENRDASLQANTDEIMCRIAAMLPEQYRGVYADHPRLKELPQK